MQPFFELLRVVRVRVSSALIGCSGQGLQTNVSQPTGKRTIYQQYVNIHARYAREIFDIQ